MLPDFCTTFDLRPCGMPMGVRLRRPETPVTGVDILLTREGVLKSETLKRDKNTAKSRLLRPASPLGLGLQRKHGCDVCNAYKLKLTDPRSKQRDNTSDEKADVATLLYYDTFGLSLIHI